MRKIMLIKVGKNDKTEKILANLAGYGIMDISLIEGKGMASELKDYNGSLLGSLRVMFEFDRKEVTFLIATIDEGQEESAVYALEREVGKLNTPEAEGSFIAIFPIEFYKGMAR